MNTRMASKMLVTGTFIICALSRSTSTKTCGVAAAKVVKTLTMPGVRLASATNSWVMRANSSAGMPSVSCSRMENPADAPMPRTGGGMNTSDCAPSICASLSRTSCAILSTVCPSRCRSSKSSSTRNSRPALVANVNVAPLRPVKALEYLTPGTAQNQIGRLPHHLVRPADRRARRKLDRDHQDRPVHGRDEAGRQARHEPARKRQQQHVADQHRLPRAGKAAHQPRIAARQRVERDVEDGGRTHAPAASAARISHARPPVRVEQQGAQGRTERQREQRAKWRSRSRW